MTKPRKPRIRHRVGRDARAATHPAEAHRPHTGVVAPPPSQNPPPAPSCTPGYVHRAPP
jgi:hypothetical protein